MTQHENNFLKNIENQYNKLRIVKFTFFSNPGCNYKENSDETNEGLKYKCESVNTCTSIFIYTGVYIMSNIFLPILVEQK